MSKIKSLIKDLVYSFGVFLIINLFFFQPFIVHGQSMFPTLEEDYRLIVNKVVYFANTPKLNDIVVFKSKATKDKYFVKRIVGLPGDDIEIKNGSLFRNQEKLKGVTLNSVILGNFKKVKVPKDSCFVLGDNRNNSLDSRSFGFLKLSDILGRVDVIFWPIRKVNFVR